MRDTRSPRLLPHVIIKRNKRWEGEGHRHVACCRCANLPLLGLREAIVRTMPESGEDDMRNGFPGYSYPYMGCAPSRSTGKAGVELRLSVPNVSLNIPRALLTC